MIEKFVVPELRWTLRNPDGTVQVLNLPVEQELVTEVAVLVDRDIDGDSLAVAVFSKVSDAEAFKQHFAEAFDEDSYIETFPVHTCLPDIQGKTAYSVNLDVDTGNVLDVVHISNPWLEMLAALGHTDSRNDKNPHIYEVTGSFRSESEAIQFAQDDLKAYKVKTNYQK